MINNSTTIQPPEINVAPGGMESLREFWQTTAPFDPQRAMDSMETRYKKGQALREHTPRESRAAWAPAVDRADPVVTLLAGNAGREENLMPLRMGRLAASPFAFLRGACAVMAGDLARTPVSWLQVFLDGDAHINNFGLALYVISMLSMAGVGYQFGIAGTRDMVISVLLALSFSIVISLIADLERGYEGALQISQQPMIDLDRKLEASTP